jgi:ribosome recycling factor
MLVKMPTEIKKLEKEGTSEDICKSAEEEVQNLTNSFIRKVDELLNKKRSRNHEGIKFIS